MNASFAILQAVLSLVCLADRAWGFSLLGPFRNQTNGAPDPWQGKPYGGRPSGLGYSLPGDIGGPMVIQESYRWNIPVITYGFDREFIAYFGQAGVSEVEKAIAIFNALPAASEMSATLEEFRLDTKERNAMASVQNLLDLKSHALSLLLEQLGLAVPERFVWSLRARNPSSVATNYAVLNLNYNPVTWQASGYVNGVLYHYEVLDALGTRGAEWASAVEWYEFDPAFVAYSSVASGLGGGDFVLGSGPSESGMQTGLHAGEYFSGLTRDDMGGLRFLLNRENKRWEALLPGVTGAGANGANFVNVALRPGIDKLTFQRQPFDQARQQFQPVTNIFQDIYFTGDAAATQTLQRVVVTPDILFRVRDLGGTVYHGPEPLFVPRLYERSDTSHWRSDASLNHRPGGGGPGVIQPPVHVTFNNQGRYVAAGASQLAPLWAAFDGSAASPVWFMGSDTNINSLVVESRLVWTNGHTEFEWTTLQADDTRYRVELSTNLVHWSLLTTIEPDFSWGNAFTLRYPVREPACFFRAIRNP